MRLRLVVPAIVSATLVVVSAAAAKEFEPGDLRLCDGTHCVAIQNQKALDALSRLYYGVPRPRRTRPPALGAPYYELRFENDYVTGIAATGTLDRFLSYGVNLNQFARGRWYRVPARASLEFRRLARKLAPLRLTRAAILRSR